MSGSRATLAPVQFGPVELTVIALREPVLSAELLHALAAQVADGVVRMLDFVLLSKSVAGVVRVDEVDLDGFALDGLELHAPGLAGEEDLAAIAERLPSGGAAAVVALELLWARELAEQLARDGATVIAAERIPATVVNTVVGMASDD
ncbi:DUF6325 family protein [Microbacterium sp. CIAB417]|uniref:DUF6325 family protein n=1 Tax=Microbacterium sp. CIAB417 TaxID=2860287 RepID=UPI001FAD307B|nr:DUF6325 family protein [Microbacterium sp. CIAB417]